MKRALLENVKVIPYTSGAAIDRAGFLSAVLGAAVSASGTLSVAVTHCDTSAGTFDAVPDEYVTLGNTATDIPVDAGDYVSVGVDLLGCRQYVKITATADDGAAATYALALGDKSEQPV